MPQTGRVVIVDGEGKRHVFPPGFDPQRAASIVKQQAAPKAEPPKREPGLATIGEQLNSKYGSRAGSEMVGDLWKGIGAGAASTVLHGGDLVRRGWNALVPASLEVERVIDRPDAQAMMTPPESLAGQVGFYGEQAAEFAVPLTRLSKATAGMNFGRRVGADAAASAAVAGVQSGGDATSMGVGAAGGAVVPFAGAAFRGATRAAAGAREGGLGGAVAAAVRTVAPSDAPTMLTQALKPRSTKTKFPASLAKALPEIKASEAEIGKPIESIDDLLSATVAAKKRVRAQYDEIAGPKRAIGSTVDLSSVADAMEKSIPSKLKLENPEMAQSLLERAAIYRRSFGLEEAETLLKETNAELDAFYNKYPIAQRKALLADPEAARLDAQGKALRDAIYKTLDDPTQPGAARELNRRYGALLDIENEATRRANVANRQQPESLSEQIGKVRAAADMARGTYKVMTQGDLSGLGDIMAARAGRATSQYLKEQQTTNALIKRAMAQVKDKPAPVPIPPKRVVRGALPPAPHVTPPPVDTSGPIPVTLPENVNRPRVATPDAEMPPEFLADAPIATADPQTERVFMLRWLSDDLEQMQFQKGGTTVRGRQRAGEELDEETARALQFNPRVAGTPTQAMFKALGFGGSRRQLQHTIDQMLVGKKGHPRLEALADAMRQAWDGKNFDWQLVDDATIARLGVRRRDLQSPISMPNQDDMPEVFNRLFGGGE